VVLSTAPKTKSFRAVTVERGEVMKLKPEGKEEKRTESGVGVGRAWEMCVCLWEQGCGRQHSRSVSHLSLPRIRDPNSSPFSSADQGDGPSSTARQRLRMRRGPTNQNRG